MKTLKNRPIGRFFMYQYEVLAKKFKTKSFENILIKKEQPIKFFAVYTVYKAQKTGRVFRACVALNRFGGCGGVL